MAADLPAVRRPLYLLAYVDEFGPIYALYTLWFADHGVDAAQLTGVFVLWAVLQGVLEIPTGALADRVDRRRLVAVAQILRAIGIVVWLVDPGLRGLFVGAVLWALHTALASGAWEALIHDELAAVGAADRYASVNARINQFSNLGILTSAGVAVGLSAAGVGIAVSGWLTVAVHVVAVLAVLALPDVTHVVADAAEEDPDAPDSWGATMREGLRIARDEPWVGRLLVFGSIVEGFFILDEYAPLLVRDRGGSDALAAVMVALVFGGLLVGGEVAARRPHLAPAAIATTMVVAMTATIVGLASGAVSGIAALAAGYASLELGWILGDARLQERLAPTTRATVTSVRSLGGSAVNAVAFVVVGGLATGTDAGPGLIMGALVLALVGASATRLVPGSRRPDNA